MAEENAVLLARSVLPKMKLFCSGSGSDQPTQNQKALTTCPLNIQGPKISAGLPTNRSLSLCLRTAESRSG